MPLVLLWWRQQVLFPFFTLCATSDRMVGIALSMCLFQTKKSQHTQLFLMTKLTNVFDDATPVLLGDKRT